MGAIQRRSSSVSNRIVVIGLQKKTSSRFLSCLKKAAESVAGFHGAQGVEFEVYVVDDKILPKNVLAYPWPINFPRPETSKKFLGEIFINPQYIRAEGQNILFMLIHGFLHLLGYDHQKKNDTIAMEKEEQRLLKAFSNQAPASLVKTLA